MSSQPAPAVRTDAVTAAYLHAAETVMTHNGYAALTVNGLAAAVGRTRPTLYKRWPSTAHLALDVVVARYGTRPAVDTGSLRADLLALQRQDLAMFTDPVVVNSLLGLLATAERDPLLAKRIGVELVGARRRAISQAIEAAAARGDGDADFKADANADLNADLNVDLHDWETHVDVVCDLLTGPLLTRVVMPGGPAPDDDLVCRTVEVALAARSPRRRRVPEGPAGNSTAS